jgi:hypothetical protein
MLCLGCWGIVELLLLMNELYILLYGQGNMHRLMEVPVKQGTQ